MKILNNSNAGQLMQGYTRRVEKRIRSGGYSEFFRRAGMVDFWPQLSIHLTNHLTLKKPTLKIVVIGCSSGEEVYSVAMMVKQLGLERETSVQLIGLDRDPKRIAVAKQGVYQASDYKCPPVEALPVACRQFLRGARGTDQVSIDPELKRLADFRVADILGSVDQQLLAADMVIGHNIITNNTAEQSALFSACLRFCKPEGLLFLNKEYVEMPRLAVVGALAAVVFESQTDLILRVSDLP